VLTKRGTDVLVRVERMMDDATRALATRSEPGKAAASQAPTTPQRPGTLAATDQQSASEIRGN
jgi:hypothetical protein